MGSACEVPCVFIVSSRLALPSRTCSIVPSRRLSRVHPAFITSSPPSHAHRRRRRRRPWSTLACTQLCGRSLGRSQRKPNPVLHGQSRRSHGSPETLHADVHGAGVIRSQRPVVTADGRVGDGRERERVGVARPPPTRSPDHRHQHSGCVGPRAPLRPPGSALAGEQPEEAVAEPPRSPQPPPTRNSHQKNAAYPPRQTPTSSTPPRAPPPHPSGRTTR